MWWMLAMGIAGAEPLHLGDGRLVHGAAIVDAAACPDGSVVLADARGDVVRWDPSTGEGLGRWWTGRAPGAAAGGLWLGCTAEQVLVADAQAGLLGIHLGSGDVVRRSLPRGAKPAGLAQGAQGLLVLDHQGAVWSWTGKRAKATAEAWPPSPLPPPQLSALPGHLSDWAQGLGGLAAGTQEGLVARWNPGGQAMPPLRLADGGVGALAWTPRGTLVVGSSAGLGRVWSAQGDERLPPRRGHLGPVHALAWSPDGQQLATADRGGALWFWDAQSGASFGHHSLGQPVLQLSWPDGLGVLGADGRRQVWTADGPVGAPETGMVALVDGAGGRVQLTHRGMRVSGQERPIAWGRALPTGGELSPSGQQVLIRSTGTGKTGAAEVRLLASGVLVFRVDPSQGCPVQDATWAPGDRLVVVCAAGRVQDWGPDGPGPLLTEQAGARALAVAGGRLAVAGAGQGVWVGSLAGGPGQWLMGAVGRIDGLAWSPDGQRLAAWGSAPDPLVWTLP